MSAGFPIRLLGTWPSTRLTLYSFFFFSSRRRHTRCGRDWSSDVCSSDLFEKRVNFPISLAQEPVKNLRLRGGRLVEFQGKNAVFLAYEMGQYRLSLLMTTAEWVNLSGAEGFNLEQTRFYHSANHGFQTLSWNQQGLAYAIVSEKQKLNKQACMICHGNDRKQHIPKDFYDKGI